MTTGLSIPVSFTPSEATPSSCEGRGSDIKPAGAMHACLNLICLQESIVVALSILQLLFMPLLMAWSVLLLLIKMEESSLENKIENGRK